MSNDALSWAWKAPLAPGPKFVLVALADHGTDHSGEDWTCWPSVERLMSRTAFKRSAVENHLKTLERDGWLSRKRRKRGDGRLGVYVYVLHRDRLSRPETPALSAENSTVCAPVTASESAAAPCVEYTHGPCVEFTGAMREIYVSPCVKSTHEEPLIEPKGEPTRRAGGREPGDDLFDKGLEAFPLSGQARTNFVEARAAWAYAADQAGGAGVLVLAVERFAAWFADNGGDYGAPAFQKWLVGESWRPWVKARDLAEAAPPAAVCAAPDALRAAVLAKSDPGKVASYFEPCSWDSASGVLTARTAFAARWLRDLLRGSPALEGVEILGPGEGVAQ